MVVTRSMSGTTKKTDTKIAVNNKIAERTSKQTGKKERVVGDSKCLENYDMKVARAESGTTKKGNAVKPKVIESVILSGRNVTCRNWTIRDDARCIFMMDTYLKRYYNEMNPRPPGTLPQEVDYAGQSEWNRMSASDKAPYIEKAKKLRAEGRSLDEDKAPYIEKGKKMKAEGRTLHNRP